MIQLSQKNPDEIKKLAIVGGNSSNASNYFKKDFFHVLNELGVEGLK